MKNKKAKHEIETLKKKMEASTQGAAVGTAIGGAAGALTLGPVGAAAGAGAGAYAGSHIAKSRVSPKKNPSLSEKDKKELLEGLSFYPHSNKTSSSKRHSKKAKADKVLSRSAKAAALIKQCRKLWEHYCERPSETRLEKIIKHCEKMRESNAKTVRYEKMKCMRAVKKEKKILKMK